MATAKPVTPAPAKAAPDKAAKGKDVKLCPACETRNKATWEYCVGCAESLENVPVTKEAAKRLVISVPTEGPAAFLWGLLLFIVVVGSGFWVARSRDRVAATPDPGLFAGPTLPPQRPPLPPPTEPPGSRDLAAGRALLAEGNAESALERLAQAAADAPGDPTVRLAYAQALWQSGNRERGLVEYEQATVAAQRGALSFRAEYAKALASAGRSADAILQYQRLIGEAPQSPGYLKDLGSLQRAIGNLEGAVDSLTRAVAISPNRADLQQELAVALDKAGSAELATAAYQRVLELTPESQESRNLLADLLLRQKQPDAAVALLREGIERDPGAAALHRGLASVLEQAGRVPEAIAAYREYAKLAPAAADAKALAERADALEKQASGPS
jgi:Flp pilus assembly protein TadD